MRLFFPPVAKLMISQKPIARIWPQTLWFDVTSTHPLSSVYSHIKAHFSRLFLVGCVCVLFFLCKALTYTNDNIVFVFRNCLFKLCVNSTFMLLLLCYPVLSSIIYRFFFILGKALHNWLMNVCFLEILTV